MPLMTAVQSSTPSTVAIFGTLGAISDCRVALILQWRISFCLFLLTLSKRRDSTPTGQSVQVTAQIVQMLEACAAMIRCLMWSKILVFMKIAGIFAQNPYRL